MTSLQDHGSVGLDALEALGLDADTREAIGIEWEDSQRALPQAGPFFLTPEFVADACRTAYLPEHVTAAALCATALIRQNPVLTALAWHCHRCLYESTAYPARMFPRWPAAEQLEALADGEQADGGQAPLAGMLYLLVLLSGIEETRRVHRTHAVPEQVAEVTLYDIQRWLVHAPAAGIAARAAEAPATWYLPPRYLTWLRNHLRGELYHLVRLQFQFGTLWNGAHFFRHRASGTVLALSDDGVRYQPDGEIDAPEGQSGLSDEAGGWAARLEFTPQEVVGHPIHPAGPARRHAVRLSLEEWAPALAPGDPVLHLHIPAGSPMDYAQCGESLQAALEFFPRHFPERPFKAFACSSWLLDRQLEALLPAASNIVRLQREVYQLPSRPEGRSTLERVFGQVPSTPEEVQALPRDTTLRRAIVDHLLAGNQMRSGRCVLFPADLQWGAEVYRKMACFERGTTRFWPGTEGD